MANELGAAYFQLLPSLRGFSASVSRELNSGGGVGAAAGKKAGGLFTAGFSKALVPLAGIVAGAAGIGAITSFVSDSISSASDLQQSIGGVDAVFGKSAKQIHKWAKEGARSVGLSENAYNNLATVIGAQLKNAGGDIADVGVKTKGLIKIGADLSATFGGTAAEAVEAISAALRGERDPIERYGISLNQAAVDAEAARLGFKKVGGALSTQANQAASLSLIYKQSGAAAGQFQSQTNTLAEQQQILSASFENVKSKIGTAFLPAVTSIVGALSNSLDPALNIIQPKLDAFAGKAAGVGDAVTKFFAGLTTPPSTAGGLTAPLDQFTAAGAGVRQFITNIQPVIKTYIGLLTSAGPLIGQAFAQVGPALGQAFAQVAPALAQVIPPLARAVVDLLPSLVQIVLALAPLIPPLAQIISDLAPVISTLASGLTFLITNGLQPLIQAQSGIYSFFTTLLKGGDVGSVAMDGLKGKFGPLAQAVGQFGATVGSNFRAVVGAFQTGVQGAGRLAAGIGAAIGRAAAFIASLPGRAIAAVGQLGNALYASGQALIGGFVRGIRDSVSNIGGAVSSAVQYAKDHFPNSPAKRGPLSGSGWRQINRSGIALADQWTSGFRTGVRDFGAEMGDLVPDALSGSINTRVSTTLPSAAGDRPVLTDHGTLFGMIQTAADGTARLILNKQAAAEETVNRLGYQPLVFG